MKKISLFIFAIFVSFFDHAYSMDRQDNPSCYVTFYNDIRRPAQIRTTKNWVTIAPDNQERHWYSLYRNDFYGSYARMKITSEEPFYIQTRKFSESKFIIKVYTPEFNENITSNEYLIPLSSLLPYYEDTDSYCIVASQISLKLFVEKQT
ncbi:MAG: hypothetical protein M1114_06275 [Candidatus Dependentiae bacterium]|nr:hypothetical protein [Candidatus Dependentiae bacterium]